MTTQRIAARAPRGGSLLETLHVERTRARFEPLTTLFAQGDRCGGVMYIDKGRVRLSVTSPGGKMAVISVLRAGSLFGEGALAGQRRRKSTAETITACTITSVKTSDMRHRLQREVALSDWLRSKVLASNVRIEEDIVNQIFNRSDKRLARALLLLAGFDQHQQTRQTLPTISRALLAEMTDLSRPTVDKLMNSFRKRGFLERQTLQKGGVQIHRSMLSVLLQS
jgi:CRP/FNR family transcriptional regulator, cyclic AMP receptor protein